MMLEYFYLFLSSLVLIFGITYGILDMPKKGFGDILFFGISIVFDLLCILMAAYLIINGIIKLYQSIYFFVTYGLFFKGYALINACEKEDIGSAKRILKRYPKAAQFVTVFERNTPLHIAVRKENKELISLIFHANPVAGRLKNNKSATPMILALEMAALEICYFIGELDPENCKDYEVISRASKLGKMEYITWLLEKYYESLSASETLGALFRYDRWDYIITMSKKYPDWLSFRTSWGIELLHLSVIKGAWNYVDYLLDLNPESVFKFTSNQHEEVQLDLEDNFFYDAICNDVPEQTYFRLLKLCPDALRSVNSDGTTVIKMFLSFFNPQKEFILKSLIEGYPEGIGLPDWEHGGDTALHEAIRLGMHFVLESMIRANPSALDVKNFDKYTPEQLAKRLGQKDCLEVIQKVKANLEPLT